MTGTDGDPPQQGSTTAPGTRRNLSSSPGSCLQPLSLRVTDPQAIAPGATVAPQTTCG